MLAGLEFKTNLVTGGFLLGFGVGFGKCTLKETCASVCLLETLNGSRYLACELNLPRMVTKMLSIDAEIGSAGSESTLQ